MTRPNAPPEKAEPALEGVESRAPGCAPVRATRGRESRRERRPVKWRRILSALADGRRLTRLEAEALGDHVIHATAAYIQSRGVRIDRELVERPGRFGSVAKFAEYRLAPDQIPAARRLLEGADGE